MAFSSLHEIELQLSQLFVHYCDQNSWVHLACAAAWRCRWHLQHVLISFWAVCVRFRHRWLGADDDKAAASGWSAASSQMAAAVSAVERMAACPACAAALASTPAAACASPPSAA